MSPSWLRVVSVAPLLATLACDSNAPEPDEAVDNSFNAGNANGAGSALAEGTPESVGVLRMLNSPEITFAMLDDDVPLGRRAATNLIDHRAGNDGVFEQGEGDDDLFDSIAEVDDVPWVGPVSLGRLLDFALEMNFVPDGGELLGVYDGVEFTVDEALAIVAFANVASETELHEVLVSSTPTNSLLAARPVASALAISELYFFGPVAMQRLKDATADSEGGLCSAQDPCPASLSCQGMYQGVGLCIDPTVLPGQGNDCLDPGDCGDGLRCSGLTIFDTGFCRPLWMFGEYENENEAEAEIEADPIGSSVVVRGLATVPEDIVVELDLEHSAPESLRISVEDPNGAVAVVWDGPNAAGAEFPEEFVVYNNSRDDEVNGAWHVLVHNVLGQGEGTLHGWKLELSSRFD